MMGLRQVDQGSLFYEFSLDTHVPVDHLLRVIDRFVDLSDLHADLRPFSSTTGRPSVDPALMIRMLLIGDCFGIRSERRLCDEVHLDFAYRWFCRLGSQGAVRDHSAFSKNRHGRFRDSDLLRRLFETVLTRCIAEGLVGGEGFGVDACLIEADADRQKGVEGTNGLPPETVSRAAREYLAVLDDAAFGGATPVVPKLVSPADPAARWTGADGGLAYFAYAANYLIDLDHAIIVEVEPTTAIRRAEVTAGKRMIVRSRERFDLSPARLAGDSGYGSAAMLGWLVHQQGIEPHIPVFDESERRDGAFSRSAFTDDPGPDADTCPAGKHLRQRQKIDRSPPPLVDADGMRRDRASKHDGDACALKPRCCSQRIRPQDPTLDPRGRPANGARHPRLGGGPYLAGECWKVETLFAHLKRILKLDRLESRGPDGARDEFHLAATAQNLRKLTELVPLGQPSLA